MIFHDFVMMHDLHNIGSCRKLVSLLKKDHVVRRLWWRTSSREKRSLPLHKLLQSIVLDPAAAAQILSWGAGGKNSGIVGLWDCGIVGLWDCGEIAIFEISGFFMFFLI